MSDLPLVLRVIGGAEKIDGARDASLRVLAGAGGSYGFGSE